MPDERSPVFACLGLPSGGGYRPIRASLRPSSVSAASRWRGPAAGRRRRTAQPRSIVEGLLAMLARIADAGLAAERSFSRGCSLAATPRRKLTSQSLESEPCQLFEKLVAIGNMNRQGFLKKA